MATRRRSAAIDIDAPIRSLLAAARPTASELADRAASAAVRGAREIEGVTPAELCRRLGVADPTVRGYLTAGREVRLSTMVRVAEALDLTLAIEIDRLG